MTDPISKRNRAKQACPISADHAWHWAANVQHPTSKAKLLHITTKGFYQCACGASYMGAKQRQPAKPRKKK